ncbi:MAG: dihydroorotase [Taibaiella sp.]|nr:dihydroorotase [Taibaiella sp.]
MNIIFKNAQIINEGLIQTADVYIKNDRIETIGGVIDPKEQVKEIDASGKYLIPGVIDDQVHFREPGLTHKATIASEARAAVAGGVTSFMEMPNTNPPATTFDLLEEKYAIAARHSPANYSFFMGVANDNAEEALRINKMKQDYCGLKIFMGSSTGNMLVDNYVTLNKIFGESEVLIATHCESEQIIKANKEKYAQADHARFHPLIRNAEACFESSFSAVQLAKQNGTRLHILHISTAKELQLFTNLFPLENKRITSEVCVHHLTFCDEDYEQLGNLIQCNPAIKSKDDRAALWEALLDDRLDIIATDHAPHTWEEKQQPYGKAPSGLPLVQHSLLLMLQHARAGKISLEKMVEKMCHAPATCFQIAERGYIREGYYADLVLVDPGQTTTVDKSNILYKCGWSPLEGRTFDFRIAGTYVNGHQVWDGRQVLDQQKGMRLKFDR